MLIEKFLDEDVDSAEWYFAVRGIKKLKEKEKEIINLLAEGYTSKEVGLKLYISTRRVEGILLELKKRYHAKNTTQLVCFLLKNNFLNH